MQPPVIDAAAVRFDLDQLLELAGEWDALLALPAERIETPAPDVSGWSVTEHGFHIGLANELSLGNTRALMARKGMLIRPFGSLMEGAPELLETGRFPRGEAEAPRFVRPPKRVDRALLLDIHAKVRETLGDLGERVEDILAAPDCIPHQILGDLNAAQWLRFARTHAAHHLVIAREVLAAL